MSSDPRLEEYLEDPFLRRLYGDVQAAGPLRSITVDLTEVCNLRCQGCYFFVENMDDSKSPRDERVFDEFIEEEKARGTNYITVLGGEPSLRLGRLKKLHEAFRVLAVTNGIKRIPEEGFEKMAIAISVWGDHDTDRRLRGSGKLDVFAHGLENYKDDRRAVWYLTLSSRQRARGGERGAAVHRERQLRPLQLLRGQRRRRGRVRSPARVRGGAA